MFKLIRFVNSVIKLIFMFVNTISQIHKISNKDSNVFSKSSALYFLL